MIHPNNDLTREEFHAKIQNDCGWYLDLMNSYPNVIDSIGSGGISEAIKYERLYQLAKWGDEIHSWDRFQNILGEEYGESCKASLELDGDYTKYRQELVEVAAVAIRTIQAIDRASDPYYSPEIETPRRAKPTTLAEWLADPDSMPPLPL